MMAPPKIGAASEGLEPLASGRNTKSQGSVFEIGTYRSQRFASMPSTEHRSKVSLVVPRDGRLFLVGAFAMGGA
ncbi:hypothetical protein [Jiella sp. M17.18]|uniref:hypothetical protein n=1 Tax=Jiella sp. M17.18 TaxID=3234247 RepID=UPI0034E00F74